MKTSLTALLLGAGLLVSTGCVAQRQADELATANRTLKEQIVELQERNRELNQRLDVIQQDRAEGLGEFNSLAEQRDALQQQVDALGSQLNAKDTEIAGLKQRLSQRVPGALPPELDRELKEFARRFSNIASYDTAEGAVRFKSDLTFPLGSTQLSSAAEQSLKGLAEIINSAAAQGYEARIVGHTDNVPIRKPATKAQHPTNWHLSVHRAIAVKDELTTDGVAPHRVSVVGYGMYRPVVKNDPRRGAEQNRRVEIYLLPMAPVNLDLVNEPQAGAAATGG